MITLINNSILTVAVAIALYNYRTTVLTNFMDIVSELLEECKNFNISSERVFSIVNNKEFKKEEFGKNELENIEGNFEFKNVTFGYNKNLVLKDMSFKIKSGETIGFVGKSGSGKTTIFNLLCKLYNINSGEILHNEVTLGNGDNTFGISGDGNTVGSLHTIGNLNINGDENTVVLGIYIMYNSIIVS